MQDVILRAFPFSALPSQVRNLERDFLIIVRPTFTLTASVLANTRACAIPSRVYIYDVFLVLRQIIRLCAVTRLPTRRPRHAPHNARPKTRPR